MADSPPLGDKCPLCQQLGRSGTLELRQINAYDALWICGNPKCPYPVHLGVPTVPNFLPELLVPPTPPHSPLTTQVDSQTTAHRTRPNHTTSKPNGATGNHRQSNGTNSTSNMPAFKQFPVPSAGHFHSTSSVNFTSFYSSPSLPQGNRFSAVDSVSPVPPIPNDAQCYSAREYSSLQEEFDALFEDDVTEDPPQTQSGPRY